MPGSPSRPVLIVLGLIMGMLLLPGTAPASGEEALPPSLAADQRLAALLEALPSGWAASIENSLLVLARRDPVTIAPVNRMNAPVAPSDAGPPQLAGGRPGRTCIRLIFSRRPDEAGLAGRRRYRKALDDERVALAQRLEVMRFVYPAEAGESPNRKGPPPEPEPAELERLAQFEAEAALIEKRREKWPDYVGSEHEFFLAETEGLDDRFNAVSPPAASEEGYRVLRLLGELLPPDPTE